MLRVARAIAPTPSSDDAGERVSNPAVAPVPAELVRQTQAGDAQATQQLLRQVAPHVRRTVKGVLRRSDPDLEDTIQEALFAFIKALPQFRFENSVVHYAVRIAFRVALAARQRSRKLFERFDAAASFEDAGDAATQSPSDAALAHERRRAMERALAKLPATQAEVLVLWMVLEYSISEVASICDISPNTVKSRLRLGRQALHEHIERDAVLRSAWEGLP